MNLAACLREDLAAARARGEPFDSAWHGALACLPLDEPHERATAQRREIASWREALAWARPAFHRAYYRRPPALEESAAAALEDLAA